jgi:acetyl/propionyl-CoA carboxylase alpha subunit
VFIGPSPDGDSCDGRQECRARADGGGGRPVVPGTPGPVVGADEVTRAAERVGFPLILKAAAGGGGMAWRG